MLRGPVFAVSLQLNTDNHQDAPAEDRTVKSEFFQRTDGTPNKACKLQEDPTAPDRCPKGRILSIRINATNANMTPCPSS